MPEYPFSHDGPVFGFGNELFEIAYYSHGGKKYKRARLRDGQAWNEAVEHEIDNDHFWMVVACIERKPRHASL